MKLMQILKTRKGFTLMELIVVLIIIAILMAALLPSLIGWINDARESALRVEGRTALTSIQGVVTQARGTGFWSNAGRTPYTGLDSWALINNDLRFQSLMQEAGIYGSTTAAYAQPFARPGATVTAILGIYLEGDNVVGIRIRNTTSATRNSDGLATNGPGSLLVGRVGTGTTASELTS